MGNTLTCCVSPNASPKLGRRKGSAVPDYESEIYEAAAGDAVAVAPAPAAVEPAELDFGAGEGHHLQHISDREMPEGKEEAGTSRPSRGPTLSALGRSPGDAAAASGAFLPGAGLPRAGRRGSRLALPGVPTPYSFPVVSGQLLSLFPAPNARFFPLFPFPSPARDPPPGATPSCLSVYLTSRGTFIKTFYEDFLVYSLPKM